MEKLFSYVCGPIVMGQTQRYYISCKWLWIFGSCSAEVMCWMGSRGSSSTAPLNLVRSYSAFYCWAVQFTLCSSLGLSAVSTATQRWFGHSSSKLLPLKHIDKFLQGLCVASSFIALNWKNVYLYRIQEIYVFPMSACRKTCIFLSWKKDLSRAICLASSWFQVCRW